MVSLPGLADEVRRGMPRTSRCRSCTHASPSGLRAGGRHASARLGRSSSVESEAMAGGILAGKGEAGLGRLRGCVVGDGLCRLRARAGSWLGDLDGSGSVDVGELGTAAIARAPQPKSRRAAAGEEEEASLPCPPVSPRMVQSTHAAQTTGRSATPLCQLAHDRKEEGAGSERARWLLPLSSRDEVGRRRAAQQATPGSRLQQATSSSSSHPPSRPAERTLSSSPGCRSTGAIALAEVAAMAGEGKGMADGIRTLAAPAPPPARCKAPSALFLDLDQLVAHPLAQPASIAAPSRSARDELGTLCSAPSPALRPRRARPPPTTRWTEARSRRPR